MVSTSWNACGGWGGEFGGRGGAEFWAGGLRRDIGTGGAVGAVCAAHVMLISRGACRCKGGGSDGLRCFGRSNDDHVPFGGARAEFVKISAARPPWGVMCVVRRNTWHESACVAGMPMGVATRGEAAQVTWSRGSVGWLGRRCVVIAAMVERAWGASVVVLARRGCRCVVCAAAFGRV